MDKHRTSTSITPDITGIAGDFRLHISSAGLNTKLANAETLDEYLDNYEMDMIPDDLPTHLNKLLVQKGMYLAEVARDSLFDRKYIYQIFSGEKKPSRDKLIAIAFGLHLSEEETQTMLKISENRELYVRDKRDSIILFALQRSMSISEVNDLLYDRGFSLLGVPKE